MQVYGSIAGFLRRYVQSTWSVRNLVTSLMQVLAYTKTGKLKEIKKWFKCALLMNFYSICTYGCMHVRKKVFMMLSSIFLKSFWWHVLLSCIFAST